MKKILRTSIIGQQGVNLIEKHVLDMGFIWYPTGGLEAGIDGTIEIRDVNTGEALNSIILVQSKATSTQWSRESDTSFEFACSDRDLTYWMQGNAPVILVVSRPSTNEAYWVSIKDHFSDSTARMSRKVVFDKARDAFNDQCKPRLLNLALRKEAGVYFSPQIKPERLYSNLIEVCEMPRELFVAPTTFRNGRELFETLGDRRRAVGDVWRLTSGTILSVHDLARHGWDGVCDRQAVECHRLEDWLAQQPEQNAKHLVYLMNKELAAILRPQGVRFLREKSIYYFAAPRSMKNRQIKYQSLMKQTSRRVFEARIGKKSGQVSYYKHSAFEGQFRLFGGKWYLEINPTYYYSYDGWKESKFSDQYLAGIKKLENNDAVLGQVVMWADVIRRAQGMADADAYFRLGEMAAFDAELGLNDDDWKSPGSEEETDETQHGEDLFS